jgi:hypothetical protein
MAKGRILTDTMGKQPNEMFWNQFIYSMLCEYESAATNKIGDSPCSFAMWLKAAPQLRN